MYEETKNDMTRERLESLLNAASSARIGLIGDLCLDMYWVADMKLSELSRETPHYPLPVVSERYAPGGAGNAANNLAALKPGLFRVIGVLGTEWRGDLLVKALEECGMDGSYILREESVATNTYIKPLRCGISDVVYEDPRIDFENRSPISREVEARVLANLNAAAEELDVICVSDQMKYGCITPAVRARLCELGRSGKTVIVDSRDHAADYTDVIVKPNEVEASRAFGTGKEMSLEELSTLASEISLRNRKSALVTLGGNGCFVAENGAVTHVPACKVEPPIDFCGAGDTFLAGFGCMLASGASAVEAAQVATLCSAVTIKKIGTTGTATPAEVRAARDLYL